MIIDFNRYNGGGGSASGVTPQDVQRQIDSALTPYWESGETKDYVDEAVSGISLDGFYTSAQTDEAIAQAVSGLATEDKVVGVFPRMPYFSMMEGSIEQIKSAIFDTYVPDGGEEPINCSGIWLLDTAFDWLDYNVIDGWGELGPQFTIDPEERVAYIANIPAGNYIFGLRRMHAGENYIPEFDINYWSKDSNNWEPYTVEGSTDEIWENPDLAIDDYWRFKFDGNVVLTNSSEFFNWYFPKDVEVFEIRIVVNGHGDETLEINTTYKDMDEVVTQVLDDLYDLNERVDEISAATPDLSPYWTSAQTEEAITSKNYVVSGQVKTQIEAYNYVTSAETEAQILSKNYTTSAETKTYVDSAVTGVQDQIDTMDEVVSQALVDLDGRVDAISAATQNMVTSTDVRHIVKLTQSAYDQLATKDPYTFYIIVNSN